MSQARHMKSRHGSPPVHGIKAGGKRPIDRVRDSAGKMDVGTPDDTSPVTGLFPIGEHLHVIKANGIYEIKLADQIDPKRTNIAIPNTQQRVLNHGSDEPLVGRTLLTAKELFNPSYLPKEFDYKEGLRLAFEILKDLAAAHDMAVTMLESEKAAASLLEDRRKKDRSIVMPSVGNVEVRCNEFIQKADHALQSLLSMVKLFYGNDAGHQWFESLRDLARHRYGEDDQFFKFLAENLPFLKFVRSAWNSVKHPDEGKHVIAKDFSLGADGSLMPPTIQIVHPHSPQPAMSVSRFMTELAEQLVALVEAMIVLMCDKHVQPVAGFDFQVVEFPEEQRREQHVRYGYGLYDGKRVIRAS